MKNKFEVSFEIEVKGKTKEDQNEIESSNLCKNCKKEPSEEYHSCPYDEDINDNHNANYCNCCITCMQNCCDDI